MAKSTPKFTVHQARTLKVGDVISVVIPDVNKGKPIKAIVTARADHKENGDDMIGISYRTGKNATRGSGLISNTAIQSLISTAFFGHSEPAKAKGAVDKKKATTLLEGTTISFIGETWDGKKKLKPAKGVIVRALPKGKSAEFLEVHVPRRGAFLVRAEEITEVIATPYMGA